MEANNYNIPAKVEINFKVDKQTIEQLIISSIITAIALVLIKRYILSATK